MAVALVVIFHLSPSVLPGGYIGVDVFFVISGFLITGHLLAEGRRQDRISITRFWARRIRRLLPAAFLVLAVCVVITLTVIPRSQQGQNLLEIFASSLYVENWRLALDATDYLAADNSASLVQHYWSLSVEEQFYIVWPLLIVAGFWIAGRVQRIRREVAIGTVLGLVFVASFIVSVLQTMYDPASAYFFTQVRAWEFAAGGIVALMPALSRPANAGWRQVAALASWGAMAAIVLSALRFDFDTAFPGWVAIIPVAATAFLLWVQDHGVRWSPQFLLRWRPIQFVGDTSYSIYLWHWPLIVVVPIMLGQPLGLVDMLAIAIITVALAALTKYFVEDPARRARGRFALRRVAFGFMFIGAGALTIATLAPAASIAATVETQAQQLEEFVADHVDCAGANAILNACKDPYRVTDMVDPAAAATDSWHTDVGDCTKTPVVDGRYLRDCHLAGGDFSLVLVGDSHAMHVYDPLSLIARENGWTFDAYMLATCSGFESQDDVDAAKTELAVALRQNCVDRGQWVIDTMLRQRPDVVIYSSREGKAQTVEEIEARMRALIDAGITVVAFEDGPNSGQTEDIPACIEASAASVDPCTTPLPDLPDRVRTVAESLGQPYITYRDIVCDAKVCHSVIGGLVVYRDGDHITRTFALSLIPALSERLGEALGIDVRVPDLAMTS